ncbi:actin nucleation-promoting factor WASL-like isoform X2 [Prinia subflava]
MLKIRETKSFINSLFLLTPATNRPRQWQPVSKPRGSDQLRYRAPAAGSGPARALPELPPPPPPGSRSVDPPPGSRSVDPPPRRLLPVPGAWILLPAASSRFPERGSSSPPPPPGSWSVDSPHWPGALPPHPAPSRRGPRRSRPPSDPTAAAACPRRPFAAPPSR